MLQTVSISVGELGTNCYLVFDPKKATGVVIDPGADVSAILTMIEQNSCGVDKIILTHGHADHIAAADRLREHTKAKVYIHQADAEMAADEGLNLSRWLGSVDFKLAIDEVLQDGQIISMAGSDFEVIHTPGHTPGGICLYHKGLALLFSGDTLFKAGVGRTDLPGGDQRQLQSSVQKLLAELPGKTKVFPGHGSATTILAEQGVIRAVW